MIDTRSWSQLSSLMLTAKRLTDGLYAGPHTARHYGPGLDFHDYRAYVPGDDLSAVDWKLFGRTDRYYLKRYQRQTDLHLYLLVDVSASMRFAGLDRKGQQIRSPQMLSKFDYVQQMAAALAFLAIRQGDCIGVGLFDRGLIHHEPVAGSWAHLQRVIGVLERAEPGNNANVQTSTTKKSSSSAARASGGGGVGAAMAQAHALLPRRGLVMILSDFLDEPASLFDGLNRLRHARFDVAAIAVLTPQERDLAAITATRLQMVDLETRDTVVTDVRMVAQRYQQVFADHLDIVRQGCVGRGVDYALTTTNRPVIETLRGHLAPR